MTNKEAQIIIGNIPIKPEVLDDCYDVTEYQAAKAMAIKALDQRWIPVGERLSEPRQYVLISTDDAYLKQINPCFGWCDGKYWYAYTANGMYCINYPIAWMPLPELYEAESDKEGEE